MSTTAKLDSPRLELSPGGEAIVPLHIRNTGQIVEGYRIEVLGVPSAWATVEPAVIDGLYPDTSTTATITFRPPRSASVPAGSLDFGVRVVPVEHPDEAVVPEGVVEVLPFLDTTAELIPRTSQGRRGGVHRLAIDNRGNVPVTLTLSGTDPNEALGIRVNPPQLTVPPGHAAFSDVRVRPVESLWRGASLTHPFQVIVSADTTAPVVLDGSYVQPSMLPKWLLKALIAALALLALLAILWFTVLKPSIESAAQEAVAEEVEAAQEAAAEAQEAAGSAGAAAAGAEEAAEAAGSAASSADERVVEMEEVVSTFVAPSEVVAPMSERLFVAPLGGTSGSASYLVPDGSTLRITDFVLSNPQGDFGRVVIDQDGSVLFDLALENFRDLDYHFQAPIVVGEGQELTVTVGCRVPGAPPAQDPPPTRCDTSVYFGGTLSTPAPPPAAEAP